MASYVPASAYGVTKATLNSMTYGMAHVFAKDGIRVNAIAPGLMETPANKASLPAETYARVQSTQLLKARGTAEDIVALASISRLGRGALHRLRDRQLRCRKLDPGLASLKAAYRELAQRRKLDLARSGHGQIAFLHEQHSPRHLVA